MGHKTVTILENAYDALAALKRDGESFTNLMKRITGSIGKKSLAKFAGRLKDEKFENAALEVRHYGEDVSRLERTQL